MDLNAPEGFVREFAQIGVRRVHFGIGVFGEIECLDHVTRALGQSFAFGAVEAVFAHLIEQACQPLAKLVEVAHARRSTIHGSSKASV